MATVERPHSESRDFATAYEEHRGAVVAMLRSEFHGRVDVDEVYQDAWADLLEMYRLGEEVRHVRALLKTIAWRRARGVLRADAHYDVVDDEGVLEALVDGSRQPDHEIEIQLDHVALRHAVEELTEREAAVIKMRFEWRLSSREIEERLGITQKRLEKITTKAYAKLAAALGDSSGGTTWDRRRRSLLLMCEMGLATEVQHARARRMVAEDLGARATLLEVRALLHGAAAVVPVPLLFDLPRQARVGGAITDRLSTIITRPRPVTPGFAQQSQQLADVVDRSPIAALLAGGGAGAAKLLALCLALGGSVGACVAGVRFLERAPASSRRVAQHRVHRARPPLHTVARPDVVSHAVVIQPATRPVAAHPSTHSRNYATQRASSTHYVTPPSPAPAGSREFGIGSAGNGAAKPAPAPTNGGGEFTP